MTRPVQFESLLSAWLDAEAPSAPPGDLLAEVMAATARTRQRPAWMPRLDIAMPRVQPGLAWAVVLVLLLVAAVAGALVVGTPRPGPASVENGLIAFVGEGPGASTWVVGGSGSDIYVVAPDGTGLRRLTETTEVEWGPAWSPDGTQLAFVRQLAEGGPPPAGLDCAADPAACERGTPGPYAVVVTSAAPGSERIDFQSASTIYFLDWSPDGTRLSFITDSGLFVLEVATGSTQLVLPGGYDLPAWAPDGTRLVASRLADAAGSDLYLVLLDGSQPLRLTSDEGSESLPAWSPDGSRIAFSFDPDGSARASRIEVMAADGSGRSVLTEEAYGPAWSPDGTQIAFVKTFGDPSGGSNEVWVMAADGSGQRKLADDGSRPRWSPDGALVFWRGEPIGGTWSIHSDGSGLAKLPTGGVSLAEGLPDVDWQAIRR